MRVTDYELSNLILRIEQEKDYTPKDSVVNLGALRDLVDARLTCEADTLDEAVRLRSQLIARQAELIQKEAELQLPDNQRILEIRRLETQLKDAVLLLRRCLNSGRETAISMDIRSKTLETAIIASHEEKEKLRIQRNAVLDRNTQLRLAMEAQSHGRGYSELYECVRFLNVIATARSVDPAWRDVAEITANALKKAGGTT